MQIIFDSKTSKEEQLQRSAKRKQKGRKHNHTGSIRVNQKAKNTATEAQKLKNIRHKIWAKKVAAYWRKEIDTFPKHPK